MKIYTDIDEFLKVYNNIVSTDFGRNQINKRLEKNGNLIYISNTNTDGYASYCSWSSDCEKKSCSIKEDCKKLYNNHIREKKLKRILK